MPTNVIISWRSEIPKVVKNLRDGLISLFAGLIPFQDSISGWMNMSTKDFTTICGIGILLTGVLAKMCGVKDGVTISPAAPNDQELTK